MQLHQQSCMLQLWQTRASAERLSQGEQIRCHAETNRQPPEKDRRTIFNFHKHSPNVPEHSQHKIHVNAEYNGKELKRQTRKRETDIGLKAVRAIHRMLKSAQDWPLAGESFRIILNAAKVTRYLYVSLEYCIHFSREVQKFLNAQVYLLVFH